MEMTNTKHMLPMPNHTRTMRRNGVAAQPVRAKVQLGPVPALLMKMFKRGVRLSRAKTEQRMRLVEHIAVGGKRQLSIVTVDGCDYLIGGNSESINVIVPLVALSAAAVPSAATAREVRTAW